MVRLPRNSNWSHSASEHRRSHPPMALGWIEATIRLHRSCFGPAWRSPLQFAISTIGNSAGLIGASYMIVNELARISPCASVDRPKWWSKWCQTHS
jgi:hypothetical protein